MAGKNVLNYQRLIITNPTLLLHMTDYAPSKTKFRSVPGDPIQVQMHTLANGLKLFLSVNKYEPRVYTEIAVRAGSKHDPADTTGLAHYFEHMMFKGTDKMGSLDWPKEKVLLDQIEEKFEEHRREQDPLKKKELYAEIDLLSFEAAKLAAANEYDKLVSAIGAKGTNAYTWVEQTVYVNDIPSNELERWFALESERFRRPILRLFHTELETVFEEYNISQDRDFRKSMQAMQQELTPTHPYGTQTTLGRGEDLKNPSQKNIYRFFEQYYVPNNLAIVMAGDFDPDAGGGPGGKTFRAVPHQNGARLFTSSRSANCRHGPSATCTAMKRNGWKWAGDWPALIRKKHFCCRWSAYILHNSQAGLIDMNLIQQQRLLEAYAYPNVLEDFSSLFLQGKPREGQSLADVEKLLLEQMEMLRTGQFEDWLPQAVVKDMKLVRDPVF